MPVAEAAQQLGLLVVGRPAACGGQGGGVGVDASVLQRVGAPEAAPAPGLVRGEPGAGDGDHDPPGGEAGVDGPRVAGEERPAHGGPDAVRADHQVRFQFAVRGRHTGRPAGSSAVGEHRGGVRADGVRREQGGETRDQGGAAQQDERAAEALGGGLGGGTGQPPPARGAQAPVPRPDGEVADLVAEADDVQRAQGVGREGDRCADRLQRAGPLQHGDPQAAPVQGDRGRQASDTAADHDGVPGLCHGSSSKVTTPVVTPSTLLQV